MNDSGWGRDGLVKIKIFASERRPATCESPDEGVCLATFDVPPDFIPSCDMLMANAIAAGEARYFRGYTMTYKCIVQGTVSKLADGGDVVMDTTILQAGMTIRMQFRDHP